MNILSPETIFRDRLQTVHSARLTSSNQLTLFVIIRDWNIQNYVIGLMNFLRCMEAHERTAWLGNFTKTIYLAGCHRKQIIAEQLTSTSETAGYILLSNDIQHKHITSVLAPFRSILRPIEGAETILTLGDGDGDGDGEWSLTINVNKLDLQQYIVHLTHVLAETFIMYNGDLSGQLKVIHYSVPPEQSDVDSYTRIELVENRWLCRATLRRQSKTMTISSQNM